MCVFHVETFTDVIKTCAIAALCSADLFPGF